MPMAERTPRMLTLFGSLLLVLGLAGCAGDPQVPIPLGQSTIVHVAPSGLNTNPGTADAPVPSLDRAQELIQAGRKASIKMAIGNYSWQWTQDWNIRAGVDIIGGCDPLTWEPVPDSLSTITLAYRTIVASAIKTPTRLRGLKFQQLVPDSPGQVVLYVFGGSSDLVFEDCVFQVPDAENGDDGRDGEDGDPVTPDVDMEGQPGQCPGDEPGWGAGWDPEFPYTASGGNGGAPGEPGLDGFAYLPGSGGSGGAPGQDGQPGEDGQDGQHGRPGAPPEQIGQLSAFSLVNLDSENGTYGDNGRTGGGGGGGGGGTDSSGGGGGMGGRGGHCGNSGRGGEAGGHTVCVACVNSPAVFRNCLFKTGNGGQGGQGGRGGVGHDGLEGGMGGNGCPGESGSGGQGGHGGRGGDGGAGAGGAGGWCIGLLTTGAQQPQVDDDCRFETGQPGAGGAGGSMHGGLEIDGISQAPNGPDGQAVDRMNLDHADRANFSGANRARKNLNTASGKSGPKTPGKQP